MSTPNSSKRMHPTIAPTPRPSPYLVDPIVVIMKSSPANQGNLDVPLVFEARGSFAAAVTNEFGDKSPFYTARPYVLNEKRRVTKVDLAIKNWLVAMGLVITLLTLRYSEIMESQSLTNLRINGFHALVVVRTLEFILSSLFIRLNLYLS